MIKTIVLTGYGINADEELSRAFVLSGSSVDSVHISDLMEEPRKLSEYQILAFPGGFSFGDHLGSGQVLAHLCRKKLFKPIKEFIDAGKLIIGVCNGFQVLVKMGLLPNLQGDWTQEVSLIHNDTGVFEDSWVKVSYNSQSRCIWTKGLPDMELPIRHGEGRFITASMRVRETLERENLIAMTYSDRNPNGSELGIAGITDPSGRVFGLMPHPEAFIVPENHPRWTREVISGGSGRKIFENGVNYLKKR